MYTKYYLFIENKMLLDYIQLTQYVNVSNNVSRNRDKINYHGLLIRRLSWSLHDINFAQKRNISQGFDDMQMINNEVCRNVG